MGSGTTAGSGGQHDQCFCVLVRAANTDTIIGPQAHKLGYQSPVSTSSSSSTETKVTKSKTTTFRRSPHRKHDNWRLTSVIASIVLLLIVCDRNIMMVQCSATVSISSSSSPSSASPSSHISATRNSNSHISEIYSKSYVNNEVEGSNDSEQNVKSNRNIKLFSTSDLNRLQDLVMKGLNLTRIPRASEINISQKEYAAKYQLYLEKLNGNDRKRPMMSSSAAATDPHLLNEITFDDHEEDITELIFSSFKPNLTDYAGNRSNSRRRARRSAVSHGDLVFVRFPLPHDDKLSAGIEEATLRLMLLRHQPRGRHQNHHHQQHPEAIHIKAYQLKEPYGRIWLDSVTVSPTEIHDKGGKWLELDVRNAVESWFENGKANLGFEVHCEHCEEFGLHIAHDSSKFSNDLTFDTFDETEDEEEYPLKSSDDNSPALNIVTRVKSSRGKRSRLYKPYSQGTFKKPRHTHCNEHNNQKCCRNEMEVVFKELQGYEFIIQPKVFDAGYCRGKCPPKYNPASHHAVLQSLISKQDRRKAPRPCCAPKVLEDLQILHVDEHDPTKLKVATWTNMKVLECACS